MVVSGSRRAGWASVCGFVVALAAWASPATAQVTQTDAVKTPLPQPVGAAELSLVNMSWAWNADTMVSRDVNGAYLNPLIRYGDYYAPPAFPQFVTGDAITLSGLFKWRKEAIDPVLSAKTGPGYFSAKCGFTGELLLMGGSCQAQFGWYNVLDPASKTPPTASEIYPFITGKPQEQLHCVQADGTTPKTDGFCPLAWDNRDPYNLSIHRWTPKIFSSGDISSDPRYKGGYVAFAMIGDPAKCPQNKYSMYEHNQRNASGEPWVTALMYQSTVDPGGVYMAFEDLPMSAADWKKGSSGNAGADGDFNDFVFYVSGVTCAGGNQACQTGQFGACAVGRTDCPVEGQAAMCRPAQPASGEICDNVDNDCDGVIDNGASLCPDSNAPNCFHGACVASCKDGAFSCPTNSICDDSGQCVDPTCAAVSCKPGTVCRSDTCTDQPCSGVVCPYGKQCELGQCVDPCAGITCPGDRVCDQGLCVAKCSCNGCATGLTCGSDGRCVDSACASVACAAGKTCRSGACIDPCAGVACPGKGVCFNGACSSPPSGSGGQGGGASISFGGNSAAGKGTGGMADVSLGGAAEGGTDDLAGSAGADAAGGTNDDSGTPAAGGVDSSGSDSAKSSGCSYAISGQAQSERALPLLGLMFGVAFMRRRLRRSGRSA